MRTMLTLLTLGCLFATGCGSGDDDATSTTAAANTASACSKVVQYCPSGYVWSTYVTDEQSCQAMFNCTYNLYTGSCRQILADSFNCLEGVTDASGCDACDSIMSQVQSSCPYPASCVR